MHKIITMNKVILQLWEESIKGSSSIPDGCTIHINSIEKDKYIEKIYSIRIGKEIPDHYERIVGQSIEGFVEDEVYQKLIVEKNIRLSQNELNNLIYFEELTIKEK